MNLMIIQNRDRSKFSANYSVALMFYLSLLRVQINAYTGQFVSKFDVIDNFGTDDFTSVTRFRLLDKRRISGLHY